MKSDILNCENSSFKNGFPYAFEKKLVCPNCSKSEYKAIYGFSERVISEAVFLIVRTNKTTNEKFLGCPNFPNCRHSDDVFSVRQSKINKRIYNIDYEDDLRPY